MFALRHPDHIFAHVWDHDRWKSVKVADVQGRATKIAAQLKAISHPEHNEILAVSSEDPVTFIAALIAAQRRSAVALPWPGQTKTLNDIAETVPISLIANRQGIQRIADAPSNNNFPHFVDLVMMTSGSTGVPKGVGLSVANVLANNLSAGSQLGVARRSHWICEIDFSLMSGLCHCLMAWCFDIPLVLAKGCPSDALVALIDTIPRPGYGGSPIHLIKLSERLKGREGLDLQMVSSGDYLTGPMIKEIRANLPGVQVNKMYGLTEVGGRLCVQPDWLLQQTPDSVGHPIPGQTIAVYDEDTDQYLPLIEGNYGEVTVRSPLLFKGYFIAGEAFSPHTKPWFHTGDFARVTNENGLELLGRINQVAKIGGLKVSGQKVEQMAAKLFPTHHFIALFVEHPLVGKTLSMIVAAKPGTKKPLSAKELRSALIQHLSPHELPTAFTALNDELPRLRNGKLDRVTLKHRITDLPILA